MEIHLTPIDDALQRIFSNKSAYSQFKLTVDIYTEPLMKDIFNPLVVNPLTIKRDYIENITDEIIINLTMGMGDYARIIYPARNDLKIGLKFTLLTDNEESSKNQTAIEYHLFKAILVGDTPSPTIAQGTESVSKEALNISQLIDVSFQLISIDYERIKTVQTGAQYRKQKPFDILAVIIKKQIEANLYQPGNILNKCNIVPFNNDNVFDHIAVPLSTYVTDLAHTLQDKPGCYNADIGSYIQDDCWYVYPLFDTNRYNTEESTCTIYILPKKKYPNIERTWLLEGSDLSIAISSDTTFKDDNGSNFINSGNGVRLMNASSLMNPGLGANNQFKMSRNANCKEFITQKTGDGVNNAPWSNIMITGNVFKETSKIAARYGGTVPLVWKNSRADLIKPGMPCKIVYFDADEMKNIYGIILGAITHYIKPGGIGSNVFISSTSIAVFVNGQVSNLTT